MKNYFYRLFSNTDRDIFIKDIGLTVPKNACLEVSYCQVKKSLDIRRLFTNESLLLQKVRCSGNVDPFKYSFAIENKYMLDELIYGVKLLTSSPSLNVVNSFRNIETPFDGMVVCVHNSKSLSPLIKENRPILGVFVADKMETEFGFVQKTDGSGFFAFDYEDKVIRVFGKKAAYIKCEVKTFDIDDDFERLNVHKPIKPHRPICPLPDHFKPHRPGDHNHPNHNEHQRHHEDHFNHGDHFEHEDHFHHDDYHNHCPGHKHHRPVDFPDSVGDLFIDYVSMITTPQHGVDKLKFKFECENCEIIKIRENKMAILNSIFDCPISLEVVGNEIFVTISFCGFLQNGHEYNLLMPSSMFTILTNDGIILGSPKISLSKIIV